MHECVFYGRSSVKAQSESAKRNDTQGRGVGAASFSYEIVFLSGCFEAREARRESEGLASRAGLGGSPTSLPYTKLHLPPSGSEANPDGRTRPRGRREARRESEGLDARAGLGGSPTSPFEMNQT